MNRASVLFGVCLLGLGLAARPADSTEHASAAAAASVRIVEPGGIQVVAPLVLPTVVTTSAGTPDFAGNATTIGTNGAVYARNARLTVRRQAGETLSMIVPRSFTVVSKTGGEALTVTTNTAGDFGVVGDGIEMSGALMNGVATSVDIGGTLALASSDRLVPGPYEGLFVVVVEYN